MDESSGSQEPIGDPTHGDGDEHQPKRKDVKKRVASHSESPEKVKDPLAYLNDDVVDIIFSFLPANTTEILRRVSKLWKAASERLNGARAFLAHFPNYKVDIEGIDDPVEANLRFRRRRRFMLGI